MERNQEQSQPSNPAQTARTLQFGIAFMVTVWTMDLSGPPSI